jgi:hypothetical protein
MRIEKMIAALQQLQAEGVNRVSARNRQGQVEEVQGFARGFAFYDDGQTVAVIIEAWEPSNPGTSNAPLREF